MLQRYYEIDARGVAPVRERGLKFQRRRTKKVVASRSREGAWIEILLSISEI